MSAAPGVCPACEGQGGTAVWEARDVPVRACTAKGATREAARAFPRGDVRLVACAGCGLVHNAAFDPARLDAAGPGPLDRTTHVPGHRERLRQLAERLVERWSLRLGRVVEVGCGQGELLAELCRAGRNSGTGIDPAAPDRAPDPRVTFLRQRYGAHHVDVPAHLLLSRYLLEHHARPRAFVECMAEQLRRTLPRGKTVALALLEVPDARATLEGATFWEAYYEHCSHFTAGSLARIARRAGIEPLELTTRGKSLTLVGRHASRGGPAPPLDGEDDLEAIHAAARTFAERARPRLERLRTDLEAARGHQRVALWGAGARTAAFLAAVGPRAVEAVDCVVDVDPDKQGTRMAGTGQEVIAPEELARRAPDLVLVMNELYVDEVRRDLERLAPAPRVQAA